MGILNRSDTCSRCGKSLSLISKNPDKYWDFHGKLCNACFTYVKNMIKEYDVVYVGGYSRLPLEVEGKLFIYLFDNKDTIVFIPDSKNDFAICITKDSLLDTSIVTETSTSLRRTVMTMGLKKTAEKKLLQIDFLDGYKTEKLILYVKENLESASNNIYMLLDRNTKKERTGNITSPDQTTVDVKGLYSKPASTVNDDSEQKQGYEAQESGKDYYNDTGYHPDYIAQASYKEPVTEYQQYDKMNMDRPVHEHTSKDKEKAYYRGYGEMLIRITKHHDIGRKAASWLTGGPIGYAVAGRDSKRTVKAKGTLIVTNRAIYCAGNRLEYDQIIAFAVKGTVQKKIHLVLDKSVQAGGRGFSFTGGDRISIEIEISTKDIDGLFNALERARLENIEF